MMTEQERTEEGWPSFARVAPMVQVSPGVWVKVGKAYVPPATAWQPEPDRVEGEGSGHIGEQGE